MVDDEKKKRLEEAGWKVGDADEFLEDIMTEHVCEWKPDIYEKAYLGARCDCGETMSEVDVTARINATDRLSAELATEILGFLIRKLGLAGYLGTTVYQDALKAYADILEGKDET